MKILGLRAFGWRWRLLAAWALTFMGLTSCGFNAVIDQDEAVKASWAEVTNQYKRRFDLVPQLVATVKGAANFEKDTLTHVTEARAKVGSLRVDASNLEDVNKIKAFEAAQSQMSGALQRLMVVSERYPELRATQQFGDLQAQLEGTENRIAVARRRYIETVAEYNKTVQNFPTLIGAAMRGKHVRPTLEGAPNQEVAPEIQF